MSSVDSRFQQLKIWSNIFGYLSSASSLIDLHDKNQLLQHCLHFQQKLGDVDGNELHMELSRFVSIIRNDLRLITPTDFLQYIYKNELQELYPNVAIALRILLTTPTTVASPERSFSTLKLTKIFNRSSMLDDRLSSLAMISIESKVARKLDLNEIIERFIHRKKRRNPFI